MSKNRAPSDVPILDVLADRWSPRAFSERSVESDKVASMMEAARWAPSCFNEQPWSFIIADKHEDPDGYHRLFDCMLEGNQAWAGTAPILMLSVAKMFFEYNNKPNRFGYHDLGMAVGNLLAQASSMDLYVHQMAGYHKGMAQKIFRIPQGYEPVAMFAVGYLGDPSQLPEGTRERETEPRKRYPVAEFTYAGIWDKPYSF